jgi:hypothetical protein
MTAPRRRRAETENVAKTPISRREPSEPFRSGPLSKPSEPYPEGNPLSRSEVGRGGTFATSPELAEQSRERDRTAEQTGAPAEMAELARCGEVVRRIGGALGLTPERLAAAEAIDRLEADVALTLDQVAAWNAAGVREWFAALGSDLRLDLLVAGADPDEAVPAVGLRADPNPAAALERFVTDAQAFARSQGNALAVEVRLSIIKMRAVALARSLLTLRQDDLGTEEMLSKTTTAVFYSTATWDRLLTTYAISDWEQRGLAADDSRAFALLCDAAGYLAGPALEVLGTRLDAAPRWLQVSRAAWRRFQERAAGTRTLRAEEGTWANAPLVLTPAHLRVESRAPGLESTAERIAAMRAGLAAAYLADTVHDAAGEALILRFAGPRPCTCRICRTPAEPAGQAYHEGSLARLAAWAYDNASPDKLAIARECLAGELPPGGEVALAEVEHAAAHTLEAAKANFVLYLRRNTAQYFAVRQQALDAVVSYAAGVRKAVSDLTGDVVDNVYRTVALLIGVVVASLVQPSLSLGVQRLAAVFYTLYLAFVVAFVLGARQRRFDLEAAEVCTHLDAMPELSAAERARLLAQAGGADAYFTRYFRLSRLIYVALAAAALLYFLLLLTPLAAHLPLAVPRPTATPLHR